MIASAARQIDPGALAEPLRFNAPLFRSLVQRLDNNRRCVVLDLGAAHTQTIATFGRFRCRLDIADLTEGLDKLNSEPDPRQLRDRAEAMLPTPHGEAADAILCWDVLNYLDRPALRTLMACVAARAGPGTLVHALIVYSDTHMPDQPGLFVPQEDQSLVDVSVFRHERPAPRYTPYDLSECLPGYTLDRAMLLSNGMQEMLFRL